MRAKLAQLIDDAQSAPGRLSARRGKALLVMMTDDERLSDPLAAARRLPKGSIVIIRSREDKKRRGMAKALRTVPGLVLLAANDPLLAASLDGLHLSEHRAREAGHWRAVRPGWVITVAAHSARGLRAQHADAALLSPVFSTKSHRGIAPLGVARARSMARASPLPVVALGGVSLAGAVQLRGFAGVAGISIFLDNGTRSQRRALPF